MLGLVDWQRLVLFLGLFVANHALERTGLPAQLVAAHGVAIDWHCHARTGIPVSLVTLAIAAGFLTLQAGAGP